MATPSDTRRSRHTTAAAGDLGALGADPGTRAAERRPHIQRGDPSAGASTAKAATQKPGRRAPSRSKPWPPTTAATSSESSGARAQRRPCLNATPETWRPGQSRQSHRDKKSKATIGFYCRRKGCMTGGTPRQPQAAATQRSSSQGARRLHPGLLAKAQATAASGLGPVRRRADEEPGDKTELMQRLPQSKTGDLPPSEATSRPSPTRKTVRSIGEPATTAAATAQSANGEAAGPAPSNDKPRGPQPPTPTLPADSTKSGSRAPALRGPKHTDTGGDDECGPPGGSGHADMVAWTGGRNPCQEVSGASTTESTPPSQQQHPEEVGSSPARKRSRPAATQKQPDPEPSHVAATQQQSPEQQQATAASQQRRPEPHRTTAAHQQHQEQTTATPQQQPESSAYMVLRAQQVLTQLMPTLVGDQVPIAAEAFNQLQLWTRGIWGHDIQLVGDSATDSCGSLAEAVPWNPPPPTRGPATEDASPGRAPEELWKPAGKQTRGSRLNDCSLDSADMLGTETEDEAFGLQRRRRSATTGARRRATRPEREGGTTSEAEDPKEAKTSHRRRRLHAAMSGSS